MPRLPLQDPESGITWHPDFGHPGIAACGDPSSSRTASLLCCPGRRAAFSPGASSEPRGGGAGKPGRAGRRGPVPPRRARGARGVAGPGAPGLSVPWPSGAKSLRPEGAELCAGVRSTGTDRGLGLGAERGDPSPSSPCHCRGASPAYWNNWVGPLAAPHRGSENWKLGHGTAGGWSPGPDSSLEGPPAHDDPISSAPCVQPGTLRPQTWCPCWPSLFFFLSFFNLTKILYYYYYFFIFTDFPTDSPRDGDEELQRPRTSRF